MQRQRESGRDLPHRTVHEELGADPRPREDERDGRRCHQVLDGRGQRSPRAGGATAPLCHRRRCLEEGDGVAGGVARCVDSERAQVARLRRAPRFATSRCRRAAATARGVLSSSVGAPSRIRARRRPGCRSGARRDARGVEKVAAVDVGDDELSPPAHEPRDAAPEQSRRSPPAAPH